MDPRPPISPEAFIHAMRTQFEQVCRQVAEAVNPAPTGQVIHAREEKVRDLFARFRQAAVQTAVPMKIEAAEAAFSPSASPNRPTAPEQGTRRVQHPDRQ